MEIEVKQSEETYVDLTELETSQWYVFSNSTGNMLGFLSNSDDVYITVIERPVFLTRLNTLGCQFTKAQKIKRMILELE